MSTSAAAAAAAAAGTVRLYCQDCSARFSLPAPPSPFDFTLCPRCRRGYLDDCPAPNPLPLWPSSPPSPSSPSAMLPRPPPPPLWISSWSSSSSATPPPPPQPPPPPLPWPSSPPSPSLPSAMLPLPPPLPWIPSSSSFSSATKLPPPWVPSSSASSSLRTTLSRTPSSPCTRASSSSTGLPPPPPPTTSSGTTTSSAAPVPYYCPKHFAVATRKESPFPLERCPNCRVHDFHEDAEQPVSSSTTVSPISSAYSSASSSPLWLPPPPPPPPPELYQDELQPGSPPLTMERADFVDANVELQPAPTAWTARLPVVTVADNEVLCAHCTNPILRRGRLLPCGHQYHASCIMPWLLRRNSCPVWDCQWSLQGSPPPPPPRPQPQPPSSHLDYFFDPFPGPAPSLTSTPSNTWDYFFSPSAEERAPQHRSGLQSAPWTLPLPPPPVSIYAPLINSPVHRGGSQAAPAASIAALPTVTISDTGEVCAVCTERLPLAAAARRLPCGHLYHSDCIVPWLSRRNSCPVCRRSIPMFPSPTAETAPSPSPSPSPSLPQPTPGRRRSLPGARRIRRICHRLLRYMEISRSRQPNRSGNIVLG